ncbi:MAG: tryptophan 2,3-dioxygenase [Gammaproteobacteria bacterium]|nr:tryptophan 2,3-dioxygenase [Gammaproteobacteria bacterium]TVQ47519.1 MAG: tryptophan 2,3-dioxygenase [Gammaproteobacteria bacterium]
MTDREQDLPSAAEAAAPLTYGGYLGLDALLTAQTPLSSPEHHDEMLFIIQHQVTELWLKLALHELHAVLAALREDDLISTRRGLARICEIERQMLAQWTLFDMLTPQGYAGFRGALGTASGFQSYQFRQFECLLGRRDPAVPEIFAHDPAQRAVLERLQQAPALFDEFLLHLARQGHPVPTRRLRRDWAMTAPEDDEVVRLLRRIYDNAKAYAEVHAVCELLVDVDQQLQIWRYHHMKTVERIIGRRRGTGGSDGVAYLRRGIDVQCFPELWLLRSDATPA